MLYKVRFRPAFAALFVTLNPAESITAEAGALISMDSGITMTTRLSGGLFSALIRKLLGGETIFVNVFVNDSDEPRTLVLGQGMIGDIERIDLSNGPICVQPSAYLAHTSKVSMGVQWAGIASWLAGEGLFRLKFKGAGRIFIAAYGGISKRTIYSDFIVDNGHLVAYEPTIRMQVGLSGGIFGSLTSGEGLINRLKGRGIVYLQSRSMDGFVRYLQKKMR